VPYANLTDPHPQPLRHGRRRPETFADLDGHDCCDVWDVINFLVGAANAYASDNLAGAGRQHQDTTAGKLGAATGDLAATIQGGEEAVAGGTGFAAGVSISATGEGALVGVPLAVVSAPVHGALTATEGAGHLGAATADAISDAIHVPVESRPSAPVKAKDAPGVTSIGRATNEHGQKLGPSGKPQVNNATRNTREGANNPANRGSRTVEHPNPARGNPHFHTKRGDGTKKRDSTHYNFPDLETMEKVWMTTAEIQVEPGDMPSGDTLGFMRVTMWASSGEDFLQKLEAYLAKYKWKLLSTDRTQAVDPSWHYDDETNQMIDETLQDRNAVRLGTYYSYKPN
jgi:hypothetical protein